MTVGIVDYGGGNLRSVENALAALGKPFRRIETPADAAGLEWIVLPGVGHFGAAAERLASSGLAPFLRRHAAGGGRILGICLGLQLLFEGSAEAPGAVGLGLLSGRSVRLGASGEKVPHMGWATVRFPAGRDEWFYFVHSYALPAAIYTGETGGSGNYTAEFWYGRKFIAALKCGPLTGVQFHPEKSGPAGLRFLQEVLS